LALRVTHAALGALVWVTLVFVANAAHDARAEA
jgi:hypothetical protein